MTNYPANLDDSSTIPVESAATPLSINHVIAHQNIQDAIEAIEAKVGVDSSAVTTSHDYKLSEVTSADKAVGKTATQTLTNKTLTSPVINVGSDATGDMYYRNAGVLTRLPIGTDNYILKVNSTVPNWEAEATTVDASTTVKGVVEAATSAEVTAGTATGGTGAVLAVTPDALAASTPVFNGSGLTGLGKTRLSTVFETAARFTSTTSGLTGNVNTYTTNGLKMERASTYGASYNNITFNLTGKASTLYLGSPVFSTLINIPTTANSVFSIYAGLGNPTVAATGHTFTVGHAGFKIVKSGGVISLYATQADGATENASSALTTLSAGDDVDLIMKINSTTSVDYYYRVNGGAISSATNLTANMPSGTSQTAQFSLSSNNVDDGQVAIRFSGASYER